MIWLDRIYWCILLIYFFYPYIRIFIHWPILSLIYSFLNVNTFLILIYIFSKHSSIIDKKYGVLKYNGAWSKFYGNFCNNNNDTIRITIIIMIRSGAAADRRTPLKPGAQLDLASPYAVSRTRRTESPTSLNYAKLCVELNYTGAAIGEMWGDLVVRHIVLE